MTDESPRPRHLTKTEQTRPEADLTLRPIMRGGLGRALRPDDPVVEYEVLALPIGHEALIAEMDYRWKILHSHDGVQGEWEGDFDTAAAALAHLRSTAFRDKQSP